VHAPTRKEALARLRRALDETVVAGVETTLPLHRRLASNEDIAKGDYDIHWLEKFLQVFDFDVAGNCQDCTDFANLKVTTPTDPSLAPRDGHTFVEAAFTLFGKEQKSVFWDLMQVEGVWQVDNIFTEGFDLRLITDEMLNSEVAEEPVVGMMQCMTMLRLHADTLSKATPPGDTAAYDAAYAGYRAMAELSMTPAELDQFFASNVAVFDDTPADHVASSANACLATAPAAPSAPPAP
jgi:hypothetical protein